MPNGRKPWSLRSFSLAATTLLVLLIVAPTIGLMSTARVISRSMQAVEHDMQAVILSATIERRVWQYQHTANLWLATRNPEYLESLPDLEEALTRLLQKVEQYENEMHDLQVAGPLSEAVDGYLAARRDIEITDQPLEVVIPLINPHIEGVMAAISAFRMRSVEAHLRAEEDAEGALRQALVLIISPTVVLVVLFVLVVVGGARQIITPILSLEKSIRLFRGGRDDARAPELGVVEVRRVAAAFNEMADAIVHQKEEQLTFLAGVAHDLRNPLSALKLGCETLPTGGERLDLESCRRMERQVDRLERMVGDLLDATRIEAGHLELEIEELDLREPTRAMVELYAPTSPTHEIILHAPEEPVIVRGDALRLEQVLSNLLTNATKYSPKGGPVEITLSSEESEALLSVSDRGIGIEREELPNVFMPFRRRRLAAGVSTGAGLGLSIARRIVAAHGGRIEVESQVGVGSTFTVRLPLAGAGEAPSKERPT